MATKALKDKIKKHIEDHLCITDHYAKMTYNVDDLRPIINALILIDGMNITPKPYEENGKRYTLWSYDPRKHVPTCKDCANRDTCVDFKRGDSRPKVSIPKEIYDKMSDEERQSGPIVGSVNSYNSDNAQSMVQYGSAYTAAQPIAQQPVQQPTQQPYQPQGGYQQQPYGGYPQTPPVAQPPVTQMPPVADPDLPF